MKSVRKFALDVGWIFAGSFVVFLLHFLLKPIMARYLGPEGLGLFSMVTTIVGTITLISGLGINIALVKYFAEYKNDRSRLNALFSSGFATSLIIGVGTSICLFVLSNKLGEIFKMPLLTLLLKISAFVFPFSLAFGIFLGVFSGLREMKFYSIFNTLNGIMIFLFTMAFLFLGFGVKGAVIGDMLASITVTIFAAVIMKKYVQFKISNYKENTIKLTSFGSQLMLGNVINNVNYQADIILIGYLLSATDLGYYSVAVALSRFIWRIPNSIQMVAYPATAEYWAKGEIGSLNKMMDKTMKYTAFVLLTVGLILWIFAEEIIVILFGQSFLPSVFPFKILIAGTVIYGIGIPIGGTLAGIGRPDLSFKISAIAAIVDIILNVTLIPLFGIAGAAMATISSLIIVTTLSIYFIIKLANVSIDIRWFVSAFTVTLLAMVALLVFNEWINLYFLGSLILSIYILVIIVFFFTGEDREICKKIIHSGIFRLFGK